MKKCLVKTFSICILLSTSMLFAQKLPEGIWEGYDGEWKHVSQQLIALAEATPAVGWSTILRNSASAGTGCLAAR